MTSSFEIDNTIINYSPQNALSDSLSIQSVPYNYSVVFLSEKQLAEELKRILKSNKEKHFVFIDQIVASYYSKGLFSGHEKYLVTAKEANKTLPMVTKILAQLQQKNYTKKETFLSAGGGITQDLSSFTRAIYKRGIPWTYIPTTLLAMADSCIGAKACLNHNKTKNLLGLFSAPHHILIHTGFLNTLPERDILSGYGEIIKLAIVGGRSGIDKFKEIREKQDGNLTREIEQMIKLALLVKKSVIEIDEYENNIRKALNYGHTIGHAIEPLVSYKIPHGIAVSIGMILENLIATEWGSLTANEARELNSLIMPFVDKKSLDLLKSIPPEEIIMNMKRDKKTLNNDIYIAAPKSIGQFSMLKVSSTKSFTKYLQSILKINMPAEGN